MYDELREELITFLIRESHPNPKHADYVNRELFENDHKRQIEQTLKFIRER